MTKTRKKPDGVRGDGDDTRGSFSDAHRDLAGKIGP